MAKSKRSKPSNFVLRIRSLPDATYHIGDTADGTRIWADEQGNIFAVRTEQVVYRLLGPIGGLMPPDAPARRRKHDA